MSDVPLGFGVSAKSTADCRKADPSTVVVFHQSDVGAGPLVALCGQATAPLTDSNWCLASAGEYLRSEDEL